MADEHLQEAFIKSLHGRVVQLEVDVAEMRKSTDSNTESIGHIRRNTQDIVDTFQALAGGFKVLQGLGKLAKPLAAIAAFVAATIGAYTAWKGLGK